jgi:hypothetical protein
VGFRVMVVVDSSLCWECVRAFVCVRVCARSRVCMCECVYLRFWQW